MSVTPGVRKGFLIGSRFGNVRNKGMMIDPGVEVKVDFHGCLHYCIFLFGRLSGHTVLSS